VCSSDLILPSLFIWVRRTVATLVLTILAVAISVSARALLEAVPGLPAGYASLSFIGNVEYFGIGILAFHVFDALRERGVGPYVIEIGGLAGVFLAFVAIALVPPNAATGNQTPLWGLLFGVLCVWQGLAPGVVAGSSALVFLGERSYSIYLLHPLALFFLSPLLKAVVTVLAPWTGAWSYLPCAAITLAVIYIFASVTYALIEEPGMRVGARLIRRMTVGPTAAPKAASPLPVAVPAE
jgi:peptidoglycan/LPS O-acetylase OafA/YrhL